MSYVVSQGHYDCLITSALRTPIANLLLFPRYHDQNAMGMICPIAPTSKSVSSEINRM